MSSPTSEQVEILDEYTDWIDPNVLDEEDTWAEESEWEDPCDCWCELCGCHDLCTREDFYDEYIDYEEEDE